MDPITFLVLLGLGSGALIYTQKPIRSIGDRARTSDQAVVPTMVLRSLGYTAQELANQGAAVVRITATEPDFLSGPIAGFAVAGPNGTLQIQPLKQELLPVRVPRDQVTTVFRGGRMLRAESAAQPKAA